MPEWYQKRFIQDGQQEQVLYYLDLKPETIYQNGVRHTRKAIRRMGTKGCFAEDDLYTTRFGPYESTAIEQDLFGEIDRKGKDAVNYYSNFKHPWDGENYLTDLLKYMSAQKLRTPKGLSWLRTHEKTDNKTEVLSAMASLRDLFCATWTECVWLIADASKSETKFIISDHPVTVYNRRCGPHSQWCRGYEDPDIRFHATHTIFPLSLEKILILTNLSWVRNPYQKEIGVRPNPILYRSTMFNIQEIQTLRMLSEQEVQEINFIIKSRALRYIAASKEEWLFPENFVSKSEWYHFGHGYLLMPDPRAVTYSTDIMLGYDNGHVDHFDEYGRKPWQKGYTGFRDGVGSDWYTFRRFQGEFSRLFGPYRRGRASSFEKLDNEYDDEEYHQYHLNLEQIYKNAGNN